jgi:hypothetical protein
MLARPLGASFSVFANNNSEPHARASVAILATFAKSGHLLPHSLPTSIDAGRGEGTLPLVLN